MAELTYEEKLQLDNNKEHLKVVQGNLRIANEELNTLYKNIELSKTVLEQSLKKNHDISQEISDKKIQIESKLSEVGIKEQSVSIREGKIDQREKEINEKIAESTKGLRGIEEKIKINQVQNENILTDYVIKIAQERENLLKLKDEIIQYEKDKKFRLSEIKKLENEELGLNYKIEEKRKELENLRKDFEKDIERTRQTIEEEKTKIENPMKLLAVETEKYNVKMHNLMILEGRLKKQFNKLNPDKVLPLELQ